MLKLSLKILKKHLYVIRRLSGGRKFFVQLNGARFHTGNSVTSYLNGNVLDYIRKENSPPLPPPSPPNSCALNPIDYAVLDVTGKMIRKNVKRYIEELSPAAFIGNCSCSSIEN